MDPLNGMESHLKLDPLKPVTGCSSDWANAPGIVHQTKSKGMDWVYELYALYMIVCIFWYGRWFLMMMMMMMMNMKIHMNDDHDDDDDEDEDEDEHDDDYYS